MIDLDFIKEIGVEAGLLSLLGGAVRLVVPPAKQSLRRFLETIVSAVFAGVVVAFFTDGRFTESEQGTRIAIILVSGYLGTNLLSSFIAKYEEYAKKKFGGLK